MWCWCFVLTSKHALQHSSKASRKSSSGYSNHSFTAHPLEAVDQNCPVETSYASSEIIYQQLNHRSASMVCQVSTLSFPFFFAIPNSFVLVAGCFTFFILREDDAWWCGYKTRVPSVSRVPESILSNTITLFLSFLFLSLAIVFRM